MQEELSREEQERIQQEVQKEESRKKTVKFQNIIIKVGLVIGGLIGLFILGVWIAVKIWPDRFLLTEAQKPVIYLYPEEAMDVSVSLDLNGNLTTTYPKYENGWKVTAAPDGTLTDAEGKIYNYLYWEGETSVTYDLSPGYCVKGSDTAEFLETSLSSLGLSRREANEFIVYWLPMMEKNEYNLISFQTDVYTENAELIIDPAPDTLIRVFMAWKACDKPVEIPEQILSAPERTGFTVVEWGGAEVH